MNAALLRCGIVKTSSPHPPPKNLGLLELIRGKRERDWNPSVEELKKGFRGWHQRGFLPHFDAPRVTQFVTFQLDDSFPVTRRPEYEAILKESDDSAKRRKLEAWLDRGHGECWLRRRDVAELVEKILLEVDGRRYRMQAWVVHAESHSSGRGCLGRAVGKVDQRLEREVIAAGESASETPWKTLAGRLLRHAHP